MELLFRKELPAFTERLSRIESRVRLISEYVEHDGMANMDAAAQILGEAADDLATLKDEIGKANASLHASFGYGGKVEVVFHA